LASLEAENSPFKASKVLKQWYDHAADKGGNLINFALLYHHCPLHEVLKNLEKIFFSPAFIPLTKAVKCR
jgi:hypothetical protein